jgi:hypothetical protein
MGDEMQFGMNCTGVRVFPRVWGGDGDRRTTFPWGDINIEISTFYQMRVRVPCEAAFRHNTHARVCLGQWLINST